MVAVVEQGCGAALGLVGALLLVGGGGCQQAVFSCLDDNDCTTASRPGICQPSAYCSVEDAACPSGQRYVELAPSNLAEQCVPEDAGTGSSGADLTTSSTTSVGPTSQPPTATIGTTETNTTVPLTTGVDPSSGSTTSAMSTSTGSSESTSSTSGGLDADLVLWFSFDNDVTDDWGPLALDASCPMMCPAPTEGVYGRAAMFTETPIYVEGLADVEFTALTVSFWVRIVGLLQQAAVAWPTGMVNADAFEFYYRVAPPRMIFSMVPLDFNATTAPVTPDQWHHYAATWDGQSIALYADGVLTGGVDTPEFRYDSNPLIIGGDIDTGVAVSGLEGDLDELQIWRRALSPAEIAVLATAP